MATESTALSSFCFYFFPLFQDTQKEVAESELEQVTMAIFIVRKDGDPLRHPEDIGVVIEGVEVLNNLASVASAFAMLLGLIYALNLNYPQKLKLTFEVIQKVFMGLEDQKMSPKVQSLNTKLYK